MSATDELRRLLDERGVEHYDGTECTLWDYEQTSESTGCYRCSADEIRDGFVNVWMHHLTPKQAIEATLGRGTCHAIEVPMGIHDDATATVCSACRVAIDELSEMNYCPNCGRRVVE